MEKRRENHLTFLKRRANSQASVIHGETPRKIISFLDSPETPRKQTGFSDSWRNAAENH